MNNKNWLCTRLKKDITGKKYLCQSLQFNFNVILKILIANRVFYNTWNGDIFKLKNKYQLTINEYLCIRHYTNVFTS